MILDEGSSKLIENVLKEDDILNEHITSRHYTRAMEWLSAPDLLSDIEQIEQRRQTNRDIDAIYILTPAPYIVDCVVADLERRRYRQVSLLWTSREYRNTPRSTSELM